MEVYKRNVKGQFEPQSAGNAEIAIAAAAAMIIGALINEGIKKLRKWF
jgi:hypothetical protein